MKVVFVHDHIFKQDIEGNYYTAGSFNNDVWRRYLKYFNEIIVLSRLDSNKIQVENTYNKFELPNTYFKPVHSLSGPIAQFKNKLAVSKTIKEELLNADALIARLPSETGYLAIKIAKELEIPYVVEVVACVWDALWNYGSIQAKLYAPIATYKMKNKIIVAPYAVYVTNKFLQDRYPCKGKIENISNVEIRGVSEQELDKRNNRYKRNKKLYTIGMIGSLKNKIKGLEIAFKALEILKKDNIDFQFQILGDGDQKPWKVMAKELGIDDKIKFCGVLPGGPPVLNWLDNIDIYIQPSYQEGLPRAVIEAMSRGCPVVGSSAGGIPELIGSSNLHKPGDYKTLAKILGSEMLDIEHAKQLSLRNYEESKKYEKDILDKKRNSFWIDFVKGI